MMMFWTCRFCPFPLHSSILKPDFDLDRYDRMNCCDLYIFADYAISDLDKELHTWASVRPNEAANWRRSGFVIYFCIWNRFSNPFLWRWEKTARVQDFLRFPLGAKGWPTGAPGWWWWCMGKNPAWLGLAPNKSGGGRTKTIAGQY